MAFKTRTHLLNSYLILSTLWLFRLITKVRQLAPSSCLPPFRCFAWWSVLCNLFVMYGVTSILLLTFPIRHEALNVSTRDVKLWSNVFYNLICIKLESLYINLFSGSKEVEYNFTSSSCKRKKCWSPGGEKMMRLPKYRMSLCQHLQKFHSRQKSAPRPTRLRTLAKVCLCLGPTTSYLSPLWYQVIWLPLRISTISSMTVDTEDLTREAAIAWNLTLVKI